MPIHFSIGFVVTGFPLRPYVCECTRLNTEVRVSSLWPYGCNPGCGCEKCACIRRGSICAPRGDDTRILFSVYDTDGDEFDISGADEIVFIVAEGSWIAGNIYPGNPVYIEKRLTDGEILIAGTDYQFIVDVTAADTADLPRTNLYYEVQVTTSAGLKKTVSAGIFKAENTMIKDLP